MSIYTDPPEWEDAGKKPPSSKRGEGWKPGDRVPASWLNWFWFSTVNSLREIAGAFVSHRDATSGVHGVPEGETIATARYVDGKLDAHIADKNNPHSVTKSQVGLGNVENYGVATQADAEAGTANDKYMTPLRVKQAISVLGTKFASGIYTGNGQSSRTITVGFTPKLVIVMGLAHRGTGVGDELYGSLDMIPNGTMAHFGEWWWSDVGPTYYGAIVTNGFRVSIDSGPGYGLNHNNHQYAWLAVG